MLNRSRTSYNNSKRKFTRGASKIHGLNYMSGGEYLMRGGIRLT